MADAEFLTNLVWGLKKKKKIIPSISWFVPRILYRSRCSSFWFLGWIGQGWGLQDEPTSGDSGMPKAVGAAVPEFCECSPAPAPPHHQIFMGLLISFFNFVLFVTAYNRQRFSSKIRFLAKINMLALQFCRLVLVLKGNICAFPAGTWLVCYSSCNLGFLMPLFALNSVSSIDFYVIADNVTRDYYFDEKM